ncbi:AzlD domain-containing protein [Limosilactobacillus sp.]|uniref:AzlD domain-containing protein n=1 Tax=Limosilactobacillus sp. TaxID=2773925 RepID=UPI00345E59C0
MANILTTLPLLTAVTNDKGIGYHVLLIILGGIAAFIPRYFPMRIFTKRKIPEWFNEWMKYVPVSLFTSLVIKGIFITNQGYHFVPLGHVSQIIAAVFVIVAAYFTRSMSISVITGLIMVFLVSLVL